jgi:hypothetical protein
MGVSEPRSFPAFGCPGLAMVACPESVQGRPFGEHDFRIPGQGQAFPAPLQISLTCLASNGDAGRAFARAILKAVQ